MSKDPSAIEAQLEATKSGQKGPPPIEQWHPELSGDIDIRIARNGGWYYKGDLMKRQALVRLFSTILRRESDGEYYLVTPVEKWRIQVEDTPLLAHTLTVEGEGQNQNLNLTTNVDEPLLIGQEHPLTVETYPDSDEPRPLVAVRHGLQARLVTAAFYDLARYVVDREAGSSDELGVWSDGVFFKMH
ncbi:DUF1285 domain-containing protein [Marinobacter caseinilyticus]|uniref:DUF1285 domain-containing protein n=1 Tax=Marinobacter caseinilyticus TaxID=2692195 RepID=UPI00140ADFEC|nr:DUF1285 domain-containing protein [Marinobacter caseinilyticus]